MIPLTSCWIILYQEKTSDSFQQTFTELTDIQLVYLPIIRTVKCLYISIIYYNFIEKTLAVALDILEYFKNVVW